MGHCHGEGPLKISIRCLENGACKSERKRIERKGDILKYRKVSKRIAEGESIPCEKGPVGTELIKQLLPFNIRNNVADAFLN